MSTIADGDDLRVVAGVDTHKDVHVAVVLDELGRLLDTASFAATARGYKNLTGWVTSFGEVLAIGVEGTGSWGAGLARHLRARGLNVIEVNKAEPSQPATPRHDRPDRRRDGGTSGPRRRRHRHTQGRRRSRRGAPPAPSRSSRCTQGPHRCGQPVPQHL
jgi:transposase